MGFISAYPPDQFIMLEKGATYGTQDTQIWAPYYTLHKILAGLLDSYEVAGNKKALEIARGMGAWTYARLKALPPETRISMWSRYIAGEYGGMNEVMARLFRLTGDKQFLECAKLFDNTNFFYGNANREHGLAKNVDTIRGRHANQHIPQITGALETFRNTKEMPYYHIASNFWEIVNSGYMYSIGGVAGARKPNNAECFTAQPNTLWENGFANGGQNETCATYNLLKLDRQLFMYDQTAKYMDHYERALYNHILASVAEENAGNTYHVPLNPGAQKRFGNANMNGFTCCNGTALESNTKLQDTIYFRSADNQRALRQPVRPLDADLDGAEDRRPADDRLPLRRHDEARGEGDGPVRPEGPRAQLGDPRLLREDQRAGAEDPGRAGQLHDAHEELARQRHDRAADAVWFLPGSRHGSAERRQHLLRSGPARRRRGSAADRLAPGHARRGGSGQVDYRRPGDAAFQHRRRDAEAVLRNLRTALGLPARHAEVKVNRW